MVCQWDWTDGNEAFCSNEKLQRIPLVSNKRRASRPVMEYAILSARHGRRESKLSSKFSKQRSRRWEISGILLVLLVSAATGFSRRSPFPWKPFHISKKSTSILFATTETGLRSQTELGRSTSVTVKPSKGAFITMTSDNLIVVVNADDDSDPNGVDKAVEHEINKHVEIESAPDDRNDLQCRRATVAVALLKSKGKSSAPAARQSTSIGSRRVVSATSARSKPSMTAQLLSAVRTVVSTAVSTTNETESPIPFHESRMSESKIQSAIDSLLMQQVSQQSSQSVDTNTFTSTPRGMGLFGDPVVTVIPHRNQLKPMPGTILMRPTPDLMGGITKDALTIRVATMADDYDVANLRLSVFSDFSSEVRKQFCSRSIQALSNRRLRGATSLVATIPVGVTKKDGRSDIVLGSVELSVHEFFGTALGKRAVENSILYITEVAVNPAVRRCGTGFKLLQVRSLRFVFEPILIQCPRN